MSLQVCHCGWSKVTSYQGLRIHQGKKGCTEKGLRIPKKPQLLFTTYLPPFPYPGPPIELEEPLWEAYPPPRADPIELPATFVFGGRRTQEDAMGLPPKETRIVESKEGEPLEEPDQQVFGPLVPTTKENEPAAPRFTPQTSLSARQAITAEFLRSVLQVVQTSTNVDKTPRFGQTHLISISPAADTTPAAPKDVVTEESESFFETPQRPNQSVPRSDRARRTLSFSPAQQVDGAACELLATKAQKAAAKEGVKKKRESQKLAKLKQDRNRAILQQKTYRKEQKVAEVRLSVEACKDSLDAEWEEINSVFSEVIGVVENAWHRALQPLQERRLRVKSEAQELVQKLQTEIDELKKTLEDFDKNPDVKVSSPTSPDQFKDWKSIDTSFSFGTLRTTTTAMMEEIHQKLEKLSSFELKRIPTFAVDVKLDPNTAHGCLVLSPDGKKVSDGGKKPPAPDAPGRFDMFGSILGRNRLTSGKSYWEVEVSNKTGWDLGVARAKANRKGKLSLNPENGYWVVVHFEGNKYAAMTQPPRRISLKAKPKKVGVFVDYDEGLVSFYDVTTQSHIYSFTESSFGDELIPYFSPHLKHNEGNAHPLIISAVKKQLSCDLHL